MSNIFDLVKSATPDTFSTGNLFTDHQWEKRGVGELVWNFHELGNLNNKKWTS